MLDVTDVNITLVWSLPEQHHRNGNITKYTICYQEAVQRTNCRNMMNVSAGQEFYRIIDLQPNTEYVIQVRAATEVGSGPPGIVYRTTLPSGE